MNYDHFIICTSLQGNETEEFHGIPFSVSRNNGTVCVIETNKPGIDPGRSIFADGIRINEICEVLFFLGMVTEKAEGSEWWGQNERYGNYGARVFIGDRLGRINIVYSDDTMETIPVVFGVNVWNYELFSPLKENEKHLNNYFWGPYCEPFKSDAVASQMLEESLILMENDAEKAMKYIFAVKLRNKPLQKVSFLKESYKDAGFMVSAVTGLKKGAPIDNSWRIAEPDYFLRKEYYASSDRLARRLYQFRDEIPAAVDTDIPVGYTGPKVKFSGNGIADIFTNVYHHNLHDMSTCKVDETGMPHTSSSWAPNFGCYVGFGTFRENLGVYYPHIWSRDIGRVLIELSEIGEEKRTKKAADVLHKYLYDSCVKYKRPHWKRIANSSEMDEKNQKFSSGKENDGHAAIMMFIYSLSHHGIAGKEWLGQNRKALYDAVDWFEWQIDDPEKSNFDRVLFSESEASTQVYGGYDLYSNIYAYYAILGYGRLADILKDKVLKEKCIKCSGILLKGIIDRFTSNHPRYGKIFNDTIDDGWTWEYKRFAPVFLLPDIFTYEPSGYNEELFEICRNTYLAQKEDFFSTAAGRQMGYGQGFLTQTCILFDEYEDLTDCVEQAAIFCYHNSYFNYIVPEGVIIHPSKRFWFRNSDLGNAVQQAEIIKCARLLIGLDDNNPEAGLDIIPRLPDTWNRIEAEGHKIIINCSDIRKPVNVSMVYERLVDGYKLIFEASQPVIIHRLRFGPFKKEYEKFSLNSDYEYKVVDRSGRRFLYVMLDKEFCNMEVFAKVNKEVGKNE